MAVPSYNEHASTPFLRVLNEQGYTGWWSFPFSQDNTSLWKAIAIGLLFHSAIKYPEVSEYLERAWRPKIQPIITFDLNYPTNEKYANPEYWNRLGTTCMTLAIAFFKANGKPQQADEIQKGKCPDKGNKVAYEAFATHFNLCLCWYEFTAEYKVLTHLFHSKTKNDVSLFINIAQEGDRLYYLYHSGLNQSVSFSFPFLMKVNSQGEPLRIGCELRRNEPASDPKEALIVNLIKALEASAGLTLAVTREIPPNAGNALNYFKERIHAAKGIFDAMGEQLPPLMSEAVREVMGMEVGSAQGGKEREPHTVMTCELYPEAGQCLDYHGHHFHRDCLAGYLDSLQLRYPAVPTCPICQENLPDTVFDLSPALRSHYEANKAAARTNRTQGQMHLLSHLTLPAQNSTLTCVNCRRAYSKDYFMSHGCLLCVHCAYQGYSYNGGCMVCQCAFNPDEMAAITSYYNQAYGNSR